MMSNFYHLLVKVSLTCWTFLNLINQKVYNYLCYGTHFIDYTITTWAEKIHFFTLSKPSLGTLHVSLMYLHDTILSVEQCGCNLFPSTWIYLRSLINIFTMCGWLKNKFLKRALAPKASSNYSIFLREIQKIEKMNDHCLKAIKNPALIKPGDNILILNKRRGQAWEDALTTYLTWTYGETAVQKQVSLLDGVFNLDYVFIYKKSNIVLEAKNIIAEDSESYYKNLKSAILTTSKYYMLLNNPKTVFNGRYFTKIIMIIFPHKYFEETLKKMSSTILQTSHLSVIEGNPKILEKLDKYCDITG